jgi:hypothetical protein
MKTRTGYLLKRGSTFYACWAVAGTKFRKSTHTANRKEAKAALARIMQPFLVEDEVRTLETVKARIEGAKTELAVHEDQRNPPLTIRQIWAARGRWTSTSRNSGALPHGLNANTP